MIRQTIYTLLLLSFVACTNESKEGTQMKHINNKLTTFYVGSYTDTDSKGIYKYAIDTAGELSKIGLAALSDNPSFLARSSDERYLLSVNEINENGTGRISSFSVTGDSLIAIDSAPSAGAHPCFIAINDFGYVLTANYTGGNVALYRINSKGEFSDLLDTQQHEGDGTHDRQEGPHAHSVRFVENSNDIVSVDLGTNELWFSQLDTLNHLITDDPYTLPMREGAGPRHLAFHPIKNWIYVVNELDATITQIARNDRSYEIVSHSSTLPADYTQNNKCADIHISKDGKFLYASNRGHDSIAIYTIDDDSGHLNIIAYEATRGDAPRNFTISPDGKYLLVANQDTNNIVSFKRDQNTGLLSYINEIKASKPVCLLF